MRGPRSKRARKQKDLISLRSKKGNSSTDIQDSTIDELDSNVFILPPKPTSGDHSKDNDDDAPPVKHLSKSQQRKLRRINEEKERRSKRDEILSTISKHQLAGDGLSLLRPASARGQKDSKKQALRRALLLQKAGVEIPEGMEMDLYKERSTADNNDTEGESSSDDDENAGKYAVVQQRGGGSRVESGGHHKKDTEAFPPRPLESSSTSDDNSEDNIEKEEGHAHAAKKQRLSAGINSTENGGAVQMEAWRAAVTQAKREIGEAGMELGGDDDSDDNLNPRVGPSIPVPSGPARVVLVQRPAEIAAARENLPIVGMEQEIMESIAYNDVIVLCGETGCGKTTQVPQFLYEAGYGSALFPERAGAVGVTQPRRVAAVSTATRVAEELGGKLGDVVGYQVRYDKRTSSTTALKFMTDGILLREVQEDFLLRKYSALVIDEAHERSLNTDILLGMLSRIVALRRSMASNQASHQTHAKGSGGVQAVVYPLKLIVMSATLRTEDFVANRRLFPHPPPVVSVPARQYPVTVHFSRRTELHDYVGAAFKKVSQIHKKLPPGGILVFLTGQREVEYLCRRLRKAFAVDKNSKKRKSIDGSVASGQLGGAADVDGGDEAAGGWAVGGGGGDAAEGDAGAASDEALLLAALEDDRSAGGEAQDDFEDLDEDENDGDEDDVVVMGGDGFTPEQIAEAERRFEELLGGAKDTNCAEKEEVDEAVAGRVHVLPLYAMLPPGEQAKVFRPPPPGHRLIIIATNVAETSLTIPGIRYVVDAGRSKQRLLESAAGLARFEVRWVSKASAEQRAGRAGRTGPGHCYRLFSSAHFNDTFPQHSPPEIVNTALEGVTLMLKALGVDKVANFPFPSAPEPEALYAAEHCLVALGALDPTGLKLTPAGKEMARYPITPRHSRMLLEALEGAREADGDEGTGELQQLSEEKGKAKKKGSKKRTVSPEVLLQYAIGLAAVMSVESPFVNLGSLAAGTKKKANEDGNGSEEVEDEEEEAAKQERRKQLHAAREAHSKFRTPESDALSALRVLCAFEEAGEVEAFCRNNFLHFRNLREAAALRKQLARLVAAQRSGPLAPSSQSSTSSISGPLPSPPAAALEALRRSLAAGWSDQIARRVRSIDHVKSLQKGEKKGRAVRYRSCALDEDVYLHPNSALHSTAPEFVTYTELVRTVKRPYMAGVTAIEPRWLPAVGEPTCIFSEPLGDPPPFYSAAADAVLCWRDVRYGQHEWPLPRHAGPHPDPAERAATFAAALLDGTVLPAAGTLRSAMAVPPSMAARPEMRVHRRVADLIDALKRNNVDSKATLAAVWRKDSSFLKKELEQWMQKGAVGKLAGVWKDLLHESGAVA